MDAIKCIKERRSIRNYLNKPIPKEVLTEVIDCARHYPSGRDEQPCEFIVVTERGMLNSLGRIATNGSFVKEAAACIVVIAKEVKYYLEDGSAATQNILLAAKAYGIGSCWIAGDKKGYCDEIKGLLGIPEDFKIVSLVSLGYPNEKPQKEKRDINVVMHREKY